MQSNALDNILNKISPKTFLLPPVLTLPESMFSNEVLPAPEEKKRGQKKPERMVKLLTTSNEANQKSCYKEANIPDDTSSASEGM